MAKRSAKTPSCTSTSRCVSLFFFPAWNRLANTASAISQPVPIPSYLIAIDAGNFRYRGLDKAEGKWTSGIWAEPETIEAAYWEFSADVGRCVFCRIYICAFKARKISR